MLSVGMNYHYQLLNHYQISLIKLSSIRLSLKYQTTLIEYEILLETIRFETNNPLWAMPGLSGYHLLANTFLDYTKNTVKNDTTLNHKMFISA